MSMVVYRLQRTKYAHSREDILSGEGARITGGRWNPVGVPLIYTSATPELAHSEYIIHQKFLPPPSCNLIMIQVPDESISKLPIETLPEGWRSYQRYGLTQNTNEVWLKEQQSLVLQVPSAIVTMSFNYLINPLHPDIKQVNIIQSEPFIFDERYSTPNNTNFMSNIFDEMTES